MGASSGETPKSRSRERIFVCQKKQVELRGAVSFSEELPRVLAKPPDISSSKLRTEPGMSVTCTGVGCTWSKNCQMALNKVKRTQCDFSLLQQVVTTDCSKVEILQGMATAFSLRCQGSCAQLDRPSLTTIKVPED